jgi:hypothetical protein
LLKVSGLQSFGINLFGISKAGKTTALLAGASFAGIGSESGLPNHRATPAAKLELARIFNDQMLPLNEVGLLAGKKRDAYGPIRELIYNLSEGRDRIRMSQSQTAVAAHCAQFRTIFVSTSESSFDEYARLAGESRDEGEYARCMDVAAALKDHQTIMDRLPPKGSRRETRQAARKATINLRKACHRHYGRPFERYITHLLAKQSTLKAEVRRIMTSALREMKDPSLDGALQHAARNFALLYAGGVMAIDAKLFPMGKTDLLDVIAGAYRRSVNDLRVIDDPEKAAKCILRLNLRDQKLIPSTKDLGKAGPTPVGFRRQKDGKTRFTIHSTAFRNWFDNRDEAVQAALRWLHAKKVLRPKTTSSGSDTTHRGIDWAVTTPRWPTKQIDGRGKGVRSIVFDDPF